MSRETILHYIELMDSTDSIEELEEIMSQDDCPRAIVRDIEEKIEEIMSLN